jgi:hypothetical protein
MAAVYLAEELLCGSRLAHEEVLIDTRRRRVFDTQRFQPEQRLEISDEQTLIRRDHADHVSPCDR